MDDTEPLFAAIADPATDEDGALHAIVGLQKAATREVLERTVPLATTCDHRVRSRAASILGQLGVPVRAFPDECLHALIHVLNVERDDDVIESAICAIGHLDDARGVEPILRFAAHDNEEIRFAVAFALGGRDEPRAVAALIVLTKDSANAVRDWATFGIGTLSDVCTPEVRNALVARLHDPDEDTHFEAMCGLAHHRDTRGAQPLIDFLKSDPTNEFALEAAGKLLGWEIARAESAPFIEVIAELERIL